MNPQKQPDLAARIAEIQGMTTVEIKEAWIALHGVPPRSGNVQWMRKRLIHAAQVAVLGDLSPAAKTRLEELMQFAPLWIPMGRGSLAKRLAAVPAPAPAAARLTPGTTLVREYKGRRIVVIIRERGFEHDGTLYASLSALAKTLTGQHMSGRAFFGLTERKKSA